MKRLLLLLSLTIISAPLLMGAEPEPKLYELAGKDQASLQRVYDQLVKAKVAAVPSDVARFVDALKAGASFDYQRQGQGPNYRIVWSAAATKPLPTQPSAAPATPTSANLDTSKNWETPPVPEPYSALKIGKIKLRARLLERGASNKKIDGWWGWERAMDHLRAVEIEIMNLSKDPRKVRVEIFFIGDTAGKSGGAFPYGLAASSYDMKPGAYETFTAETVARSSRWNTVFGRGQTGTKIQGYVIRTIEEVEGKQRITGYHISMPHLEQWINSMPEEIKPEEAAAGGAGP